MFYVHFFFFNDTATTEIYTLSLHDALPICRAPARSRWDVRNTLETLNGRKVPEKLFLEKSHQLRGAGKRSEEHTSDSSHQIISYAVFCLKKKKTSTSMQHTL